MRQRIDDLVVLLVGHSSAAGGCAGVCRQDRRQQRNRFGRSGVSRCLYRFDVSASRCTRSCWKIPPLWQLGRNRRARLDVSIGNAGEKLKLPSNVSSYASLIRGKGASAASLTAFLESVRDAYSQVSTWTHGSRVRARRSSSRKNRRRPDAPTSLYAKLAANDTLRAYILPFLNVSENSVYAASNVATITFGPVDTYVDRSLAHTDGAAYAAAIEAFETELDKAAGEQARYIDFRLRIAKPEVRRLLSDRPIIDSLRMRGAAPAREAPSGRRVSARKRRSVCGS
ncbi:MAG: ZmpA/ZmpB/ZmpC family metallo-endopeptidase [Eggerthellaceae bacterium]